MAETTTLQAARQHLRLEVGNAVARPTSATCDWPLAIFKGQGLRAGFMRARSVVFLRQHECLAAWAMLGETTES